MFSLAPTSTIAPNAAAAPLETNGANEASHRGSPSPDYNDIMGHKVGGPQRSIMQCIHSI